MLLAEAWLIPVSVSAASWLVTGGHFFQGLDQNMQPVGQFSILCARGLLVNVGLLSFILT